jgi:rhodanese-related sulfurtransferase
MLSATGIRSWVDAGRLPLLGHVRLGRRTVAMSAILSASPVECKTLLQGGQHTYLDVRTPEEVEQGCYPGVVNIPIMLKTDGGMQRNPEFEALVLAQFPDKEEALVVGCANSAPMTAQNSSASSMLYATISNMSRLLFMQCANSQH